MLLPAFCIFSKPSVNAQWRYGPEMTRLGQNLIWPRPRPSTSDLVFCMDITADIGSYSLKFYKNGRCDRRTDRSADKRTDGQNLS